MLLKASQHSEITLIKQKQQYVCTLPEQARCSGSVPPCCAMAPLAGGDKEIFSHRELSAKDSSGIVADRSSGVLSRSSRRA
jgi:hypothetical protein